MTKNTPTAIEALKPFAREAEGWSEATPDDFEICSANFLTVGDLRRTRAVLEALPALSGESVTVPPCYECGGELHGPYCPACRGESVTVPRVKALEWEDAEAETLWGSYTITAAADLRFAVKFEGCGLTHGSVFDTFPEAKAAAQADFERRVLACLEAAPALAPTADEGGAVAVGYLERESVPKIANGESVVLYASDRDHLGVPVYAAPPSTLADRAEIDRGTAEREGYDEATAHSHDIELEDDRTTITISYLSGEDKTSTHFRAPSGAVPCEVIARGIAALEAERAALEECPMHQPTEDNERLTRTVDELERRTVERLSVIAEEANFRAETAEAALAETRTALRRSQRALISLPGTHSLEVADCIATNRAALTGDAQEAGERKRDDVSGCEMSVGCEEAGICYAKAQGEPDRCARPAEGAGR